MVGFCVKQELFVNNEDNITTPKDYIVHWAPAHLPQKPLFLWAKGCHAQAFDLDFYRRGS